MRARLVFTALVAILAVPMVGPSSALAQGGLDDTQSAAKQQYGERLGVIGEIEEVEPTPESTPTPTQAPQPAAQATAPVQQEAGNLPFTGFAAVSVLLLGAALLAGGLVLRRSTRRSDDLAG